MFVLHSHEPLVENSNQMSHIAMLHVRRDHSTEHDTLFFSTISPKLQFQSMNRQSINDGSTKVSVVNILERVSQCFT